MELNTTATLAKKAAEELCMEFGIYLYPVKGHCHEEDFLKEYGQTCLDKYFVAYDALDYLEEIMQQVDSSIQLYATAEQGYLAVYGELLKKGLIQ